MDLGEHWFRNIKHPKLISSKEFVVGASPAGNQGPSNVWFRNRYSTWCRALRRCLIKTDYYAARSKSI
jgi:hypothetical protein